MAPEQIAAAGGDVDGRTDIYALGATLYELLTLRPPFVGESRHQVISQIATQEPAPPRSCNRSVPRDLETICLHAIEKLPARRYPSAALLANDLRCFAEDLPIAARPATWAARGWRVARRHRGAVAALTAMCALLAATAFFAFRSYQSEARWTDAQFDRVFETAQFAAMEGDLDGARVAIDQAEELGATAAQLNLLRGQLALLEGQYQDACDQLEAAVDELPHSVAAHALLSRAYDANEQNDKMTAALRRLERLEPVTLQDYLLLGQARLYNDFDAGLDLLNEAVQKDKTNVVARLVRGSALVHQAKVTGDAQQAEAALRDLQIASELLQRNAFLLGRTLEARLTAATAYHHQQDLARMDENVRAAGKAAEALADFPENYLSHRWRAFYFDYIGDDEQALASWRAMQETRIAYLVIALFRHGQFDEALKLCDERLKRFKNARFTDFFRAMILAAEVDSPDVVVEAFVRPGEETLDMINAHRFNYIVRCLAGQLNEAQQYCRSLRGMQDHFLAHDPWRVHLLQYTCGAIDDATLLQLASDSRLALTQARFYLGATWLALGDRAKASGYFTESASDKSLGILENHMSRALLAQLQRDPNWPRWIDNPAR